MPKFTTKLVERDVEVKTVEKRTIEVYEYEGREYTSKKTLAASIINSLHHEGDAAIGHIARSHACSTKTRDLLHRIQGEDYLAIYKALKSKLEVLEELGAL